MLANISLIFSCLCSTPFLWGPAAEVLKGCDNVLSKARQKEELEITELSVVQQDLEASTIPGLAAICSVPQFSPALRQGTVCSHPKPIQQLPLLQHCTEQLCSTSCSAENSSLLCGIPSVSPLFFLLLYCLKFDIVNHFST